jgi:hypothetical protein
MRPLRYYINVTLDGCGDHREMFADEDLHRHAAKHLDQADAVLFGRVTYDAAKKYVVSSTLDRVDWKRESGNARGRRQAPAGVGGAGIDR